MTEAHEPTESNRDRVRRLLFGPLGFRHPSRLTEADGRALLDRIADELAYLTDDALMVLARMLRVHGQGSARNWWPDRATFVGWAHVVQPRPLDEDPKLLSWFASIEGQRMVQEGTLVETYLYLQKHRVPPATPEARRQVKTRADEARRRVGIVREKQRAGIDVGYDDARFADLYEAETRRLTALVQTRRGGVAA
jgi:hypothetical protein